MQAVRWEANMCNTLLQSIVRTISRERGQGPCGADSSTTEYENTSRSRWKLHIHKAGSKLTLAQHDPNLGLLRIVNPK
jgi:hypothetical protein